MQSLSRYLAWRKSNQVFCVKFNYWLRKSSRLAQSMCTAAEDGMCKDRSTVGLALPGFHSNAQTCLRLGQLFGSTEGI